MNDTSHTIQRVTTTADRIKARLFVNTYHSYIKWADRPSRKMYWLLYEKDILVGVFGLGSAFARPKPVMNFMAENNLEFNNVGNNIVYALNGCIDKNAGTKFLKMVRNDAILWWKDRYGDTLKAFQTFILPPRTGAMYKADNWIQLGSTTGGKTQTVRTIRPSDADRYPQAEKRVFKSGEIRYLVREFTDTIPKLIFMRLIKKVTNKGINTVSPVLSIFK